MKRFLSLCLVLVASSAFAEETAALSYSDAYTLAVQEGKPLIVCVDCMEQHRAGAVCLWLQSLPGYKAGDIVVSAPDGGELFWIATYRSHKDVQLPKKTLANCANGKCEMSFFPPKAPVFGRTLQVSGGSCSTCR